MKFTVEIEDFWVDEEAEVTEELAAYIKRDVVKQISLNIKDQVEIQITKKVDEVIKDKISLIIDSTLTDLIATGVITYNREEISIIDHIKKQFQGNNGWSNPNRQIEKIAKEFGQELKLQYNNVFANKIVQSMKEQGLLKDEVVQILLGGNKNDNP